VIYNEFSANPFLSMCMIGDLILCEPDNVSNNLFFYKNFILFD
jgi:hypothetical protein